MSLSLKEAAELVGMSKPGILKAIRTGKISAEKDVHGEWRVEVVELTRVYPAVNKTERKPVDTSLRSSLRGDTPSLRVENEQLKQRLMDKDGEIAYLRSRLDAEAEERQRLTLILIDTQNTTPLEEQNPVPWWRRLLGA